jgi:hypothetical protein
MTRKEYTDSIFTAFVNVLITISLVVGLCELIHILNGG